MVLVTGVLMNQPFLTANWWSEINFATTNIMQDFVAGIYIGKKGFAILHFILDLVLRVGKFQEVNSKNSI